MSSRKAVSSSAQTPALSRGAHTVSPRSRMVRAAIRSDHDASGPRRRWSATTAPRHRHQRRGHADVAGTARQVRGSARALLGARALRAGPCPGRRSRTGLARRDTLRHEGGRSNAPTLRRVPDSTKADVSASAFCYGNSEHDTSRTRTAWQPSRRQESRWEVYIEQVRRR